MAIDPTHEIPFAIDDPALAVAAVAELIATGDGWVNLAPDVEPGAEPRRKNLFAAIFSSRGPELPLATISPAAGDGRLGVGLQHSGGPSALATLAREEHVLPPGWLKVADHPRRGLVLSAPADASPDLLVDWLVRAAQLLTRIELQDGWLARVYRS